jgi:two-component system sensor histidine kinase TctE
VWLLAPLALMLVVTCSAIFFAIRRTVRPLEALAGQWNRQAHASLAPIPEDGLPHELSPFATALNDLLSRIRGILVRERMFAAAAAHQLRTPLTALRLGMARARNSPDLESTRAVLDELAQVTQHTGRLVQQLMLLGRLDPESRSDIDRAPVDLRDIARDVCGLFAEVALDNEVDLELQVPDAPVTAVAQSDLLVEALANLIDNAMKAAGRKGQVLVAVLDAPARLCVCDSGPGIKPSERQAIFERYVRGSKATWEGTGLGLAIVHDIATLQGASVSITDGELGGACLTIEFTASESY